MAGKESAVSAVSGSARTMHVDCAKGRAHERSSCACINVVASKKQKGGDWKFVPLFPGTNTSTVGADNISQPDRFRGRRCEYQGAPPVRFRVNSAHKRRSRPGSGLDYGLGFEVKVLETFKSVSSWLGRGQSTRIILHPTRVQILPVPSDLDPEP